MAIICIFSGKAQNAIAEELLRAVSLGGSSALCHTGTECFFEILLRINFDDVRSVKCLHFESVYNNRSLSCSSAKLKPVN